MKSVTANYWYSRERERERERERAIVLKDSISKANVICSGKIWAIHRY